MTLLGKARKFATHITYNNIKSRLDTLTIHSELQFVKQLTVRKEEHNNNVDATKFLRFLSLMKSHYNNGSELSPWVRKSLSTSHHSLSEFEAVLDKRKIGPLLVRMVLSTLTYNG